MADNDENGNDKKPLSMIVNSILIFFIESEQPGLQQVVIRFSGFSKVVFRGNQQ